MQAYQRVTMVNILQVLSSVDGGKAVASLASTSAVYLMSLYKDDGMSLVVCVLMVFKVTLNPIRSIFS